MSTPHSYDLIATMGLHVRDCDSRVAVADWIMEHRRPLLVMLVIVIRRTDAMNIGTLSSHMVSE